MSTVLSLYTVRQAFLERSRCMKNPFRLRILHRSLRHYHPELRHNFARALKTGQQQNHASTLYGMFSRIPARSRETEGCRNRISEQSSMFVLRSPIFKGPQVQEQIMYSMLSVEICHLRFHRFGSRSLYAEEIFASSFDTVFFLESSPIGPQAAPAFPIVEYT